MDDLMPVTDQDITPTASLRTIITSQGRMICGDVPTLQTLLSKNCAGQQDKIELLLRAQEARIPTDLIWHAVAPRADLGNRLVSRLQRQYSLTDEDALWTVIAWMDALGVQVPRPRIRTAPQAVPQEAASLSATDPTQNNTNSPGLTAGSSIPERNNTKVKEATPLNVKEKTMSPKGFVLPGWAIGAVAVACILIMGVMIYITTGPPANATRAPGVIYNLPPGYKAPTRADHIRARMMHPVKPAH